MLYVPIVKSKRAELTAIKMLQKDVRRTITPFLDVLPPNRYAPKPKTLLGHLGSLSTQIVETIGTDSELFVDTFDIGSAPVSNAQTALEYLLMLLSRENVPTVPVFGFQREPEHEQAISRLLQSGTRRLCIRLETEDLKLPKMLPSLLGSKLDQFGLHPGSVDLMMDVRYVGAATAKQLANLFLAALENIPDTSAWRSIATAGSTMPNSLSDHCDRGRAAWIPRTEWMAWSLTNRQTRRLTFSDYTTVSPMYVETDPRVIAKHLGPNVKYTTEESWYVARGRSFQKFGSAQYFEIARAIAALKEFRGARASYGDRFIADRANGIQLKSGNPEQWITASVNSHITYVSQRLGAIGSV